MSRRRGEFEHRTSIFEGAYRAWSHLGGLEPDELENRSAADLDPLDHPLTRDKRLNEDKRIWTDEQGIAHRFYFYEPLPRAGLSHPYVQAILSPWLGQEADQDAIQLGLTTLRTWWQHRRKGESSSAFAALNTEKMRGVVEGYTRHFFNLAYCLVVTDREQGPRTLSTKIKDLEKMRRKLKRQIVAEQQEAETIANMASYTSPPASAPPPMNPSLTPLEKLHATQCRLLAESGGVSSLMGTNDITGAPLVGMKGKCIPGSINLLGMMDEINHHATQLSHRGGGMFPNQIGSLSRSMIESDFGDPNMTPVVFVSENGDIQIAMAVDGITCAHCVKIVETVLKGCSGTKSPIDGILDAAADRVLCQVLIKIEKSSDAKRIAFEASRNLSMVGYTAKVKEMSVVNAGGDRKATMNLGALSTAFEVIAMTDPQDVFDWNTPCTCPDNGILREDCPRHSQMNTRIFDAFETRGQHVQEYMAGCGRKYGMPCTCGPDCRCTNCETHCGSKKRTSGQALESQEGDINCCGSKKQQQPIEQQRQVPEQPIEQQYHLPNEEEILQSVMDDPTLAQMLTEIPDMSTSKSSADDSFPAPKQRHSFCSTGSTSGSDNFKILRSVMEDDPTLAQMLTEIRDTSTSKSSADDFFPAPKQRHSFCSTPSTSGSDNINHFLAPRPRHSLSPMPIHRQSMTSRNPSILSFGGLRRMSLTSEATFGRAMSGLSALSIDWENMEDFDVNVDHSAHINNNYVHNSNGSAKVPTDGIMQHCAMMTGEECNCGENCLCAGCPIHDEQEHSPPGPHVPMRLTPRSSMRTKGPTGDPENGNGMQVSFTV